MSKQRKSNKEPKKPKAVSDETRKQKKDLKKHDGRTSGLFGSSK
ncbi:MULTISPECIES: hypothetical protein [Cyanophyceae]|nr:MULTISPECIES: hypothetical protein [Cyanophyceae]